jgi:DnaJ-class molecular chaperone
MLNKIAKGMIDAVNGSVQSVDISCRTCEGTGSLVEDSRQNLRDVPCPACFGLGLETRLIVHGVDDRPVISDPWFKLTALL